MFGNIPNDTLAELILFLNEKEDFDSLKELGTVSREDLRRALNALAGQLKAEAAAEAQKIDITQLKEISEPYRRILSSLSEREKQILMKGFVIE